MEYSNRPVLHKVKKVYSFLVYIYLNPPWWGTKQNQSNKLFEKQKYPPVNYAFIKYVGIKKNKIKY